MKNYVHSTLSLLLCILCLLIISGLSGCTNFSLPSKVNKSEPIAKNLGNSEFYTYRLAQELFANLNADRQYRYAVTGFVPVTNMQIDLQQQHPLMLLGHQLEQGLITEAVRRGFIAQDFKASNSIIMGDEYDRALSRDLSHLSQLQNIDYYITGTIVPQEGGAMVNARVINVRNKDVIAAATNFFPDDLFWSKEAITHRNGYLYRSEINTVSSQVKE